MSRLIVEAVSQETSGTDDVYALVVFVSVSDAETGAPVTGLTVENFRACSSIGTVMDISVLGGYERKWEPADTQPAGCYTLRLLRKGETSGEVSKWSENEFYCFGLQAKIPGTRETTAQMGQTVVRVESLGQ